MIKTMKNFLESTMNSLKVDENQSDESEPDYDLCDDEEILTLFPDCKCITEYTIGQNSILHIAGTLNSNPNIAASLSNNTIQLFNQSNNQFALTTTLTEQTNNIIDVKFSSENDNLLYVGTQEGYIKLWDIRTKKQCVSTFIDTSLENGELAKPLNCFDVSPNGKLLTGGTDLVDTDAFILFWDIRNVKLLGGYWESHNDDITQVKFHPTDSNKLISGSTDGLINLYDISKTCEDDALIDSINTESSVEKLMWFEEDQCDAISCITHTTDLQLWKVDGTQPFAYFKRSNIAKQIQRKSASHCYIANTHTDSKNKLMVLAGSNKESNQCLRMVTVDKKCMKPAYNLKSNKQMVYNSWYNNNINLLITGGEEGILNAWQFNKHQKCNGES